MTDDLLFRPWIVPSRPRPVERAVSGVAGKMPRREEMGVP